MLGYSFTDYEYFRDHTQVFSDIIASDETTLNLGRGAAVEEAEPIGGEFVSDNFFSVLGAGTVLGRTFAPEENRAPGQNPIAVLSHPFWQGRLGGDPNIVGKTLWVNGKALVVVGVMAPDFVGLGLRKLRVKDVWLPLMMRSEVSFRNQVLTSKREGRLTITGLLKPGRTPAEASAEIQFLSGQLARSGSGINPNARVVARPLFVTGSGSGDWPILTVVFTATAIVLLIACSNIANLMLARAARRRQEIGVRMCLGASRSRLIRQLLTESLLLAVLGGGAGLLLAWWSLKAFLTSALLSQAPMLPNVDTMIRFLDPDARVLSFTCLLSLLAGLAFGLLHALRATSVDLVSTLKDEGAAFGRRMARSRLRNGLVVTQVALSMVLLIVSGLLLRGAIRGTAINPGFETKNLLHPEPRTAQAGYDQARTQRFRDELTARLEALPGVKQVSNALGVPLAGMPQTMTTFPAGNALDAIARTIHYNAVTSNYFETVGIPIIRGRVFTEEERRGGRHIKRVYGGKSVAESGPDRQAAEDGPETYFHAGHRCSAGRPERLARQNRFSFLVRAARTASRRGSNIGADNSRRRGDEVPVARRGPSAGPEYLAQHALSGRRGCAAELAHSRSLRVVNWSRSVRVVAGRRGTLRRDVLFGESTHARNRRSHGFGRKRPERDASGDRPGLAVDRDRRRSRYNRRRRGLACVRRAVVWAESFRPHHLCGRLAVSRCGGATGHLFAGASRGYG